MLFFAALAALSSSPAHAMVCSLLHCFMDRHEQRKGGAKKEERTNKGNKKQKKEKSGSGRNRASKFCLPARVAKEGNATPIGQQILLLQCVSHVVSSRTGLFCSQCSSSQLSNANGNEATSSIQNPRSKVRRKPWFMSNGRRQKQMFSCSLLWYVCEWYLNAPRNPSIQCCLHIFARTLDGSTVQQH